MKKIYASLALLAALATGATAQRSVGLTYTIVDPAANFNITTGLSFTPKYQIVNNGPDILKTGDTLSFTTPIGGLLAVLSQDVAAGQGFQLTLPSASNESEIEGMLDVAGTTFVTRANFVNNTQYRWVMLHDTLVADNHAETITLTNTVPYFVTQTVWYNQGTTSMPEVTAVKISNLNVFPNPAVNEVAFSLTTKADKAVARILDVTGRTVAVKEFTTLTNTNTINISNLPAGNYMLEVVAGDDKATSKFSVQK